MKSLLNLLFKVLLWVIVCQVFSMFNRSTPAWYHSHFLIILSCASPQVYMIEQQNHLFDIHRSWLHLSFYPFTLIQWHLSYWTNIYTVSDTVDQGSSSHFCLLSNFILIVFFFSCCSLYSSNLYVLFFLCLLLLQKFSSFSCFPLKSTRILRNSICKSRHWNDFLN